MISTIQENVPLAELTTFKIGGKARFFVRAKSETEIIEALEFAEQNSLDIFILGGGSNILIADEGFDGLVLQIALKGISTFAEKDGTIYVTANAGEDWDEFVKICVEKNLAGIECLSGIPGFVGGTPVQNVGAYGQEVSETIVSVRCFDRRAKEIKELTNAECGFAYRTSVFNTTRKNQYIVLAVTYALELNGEAKIVYADLKNYFGDKKPTLAETRNAVLKIRSAKSMVIDAADINTKSAGSFFKNPIVSKEKFAEMCALFGDKIPSYAVDGETVKIPAAWLIEESGFQKGYVKGNVGLSTRHTLAIVNLGSAAAKDVLALKAEIQARVKKQFSVELKPEPIFVGFN
ncbi:MAG: UDP-N-acetylmuramate dehydrogenase [Acidobacteriota bacterium]|nr:UDP-N-acetylmuramate dehydrogenase [Acidobacteriota bacterium]